MHFDYYDRHWQYFADVVILDLVLNETNGEIEEINTILDNMNITGPNDRMSRIFQSADVLRGQNRNNPKNFDENLRKKP